MKVLIFSSIDDKHAEAVSVILSSLKAEVDFLRLEQFAESCAVSFELGTLNDTCYIEIENRVLDLRSYFSIWFRRPGLMRAPQFVEPWIGKMVEQEARSTLDGIYRSLNCLWMNHPANNAACADKLWQLQVAKAVGFTIPESLVTNKPKLVLEFFEKCGGQVIYKLIGEQTNFSIPANEIPRGISTLPLRKEDLPFIDQVAFSPHLFQKCIAKAFDLRVTVIGHDIFAVRIDSQSGTGKIDWRHDYTVDMDTFQLPDHVTEKCFNLTRTLGLNYGAIDLILTKDGDYIFLEINSSGQYLWLEQKTQQPISLSVARLLTGAVEPLVKPS